MRQDMQLVLELHWMEQTKLRLDLFILQVNKLQQTIELNWTKLQKMLFLLMKPIKLISICFISLDVMKGFKYLTFLRFLQSHTHYGWM